MLPGAAVCWCKTISSSLLSQLGLLTQVWQGSPLHVGKSSPKHRLRYTTKRWNKYVEQCKYSWKEQHPFSD